MTLRVVIIPGNGGGNVHRANWYGWVQKTIQESLKIECQLENMPDPYEAKESVWLPFMKENLKCDERTIAIGHSSGAAAIMRYAESNHLFAAVLVSAYVSDLGDRNEAASGYFNRPWQWDKIKDHCKYIVQFGSSDDPFLPWEEQEEVAKMTGSELHASDSEGHYMKSKFPELIKAVKVIVGKAHIKQLK